MKSWINPAGVSMCWWIWLCFRLQKLAVDSPQAGEDVRPSRHAQQLHNEVSCERVNEGSCLRPLSLFCEGPSPRWPRGSWKKEQTWAGGENHHAAETNTYMDFPRRLQEESRGSSSSWTSLNLLFCKLFKNLSPLNVPHFFIKVGIKQWTEPAALGTGDLWWLQRDLSVCMCVRVCGPTAVRGGLSPPMFTLCLFSSDLIKAETRK